MSISALDNYFNGNLTDAKALARRHARTALRAALVNDYGKSLATAAAIVEYLKDGGSFQAACNAEANDLKATNFARLGDSSALPWPWALHCLGLGRSL